MKKIVKALLCLSIGSVFANGVNIQNFNFAHNPTYTMVEDTLSNYTLIPWDYDFLITANYNHADDPLVTTNSARTERTGEVISRLETMGLGFSYRRSHVLYGISTTVNQVAGNGNTDTALSDTTLTMKYRMTSSRSKYAVAVIPELILPTGDKDLFLSDDSVGMGLKFAVERSWRYLQVNANLGYRYANKATYQNMDYRNKITAAIGAYVPLTQTWGVSAEWTGSMGSSEFDRPTEYYLGLRKQLNRNISLHFGTGFSDPGSSNSGDFRIVGGVKITPLASRYRKTNATIFMTKTELKIDEEIPFHHDSYELTPRGKLLLEDIASVIRENKGTFKQIVVEGHSNFHGPDEYNLSLSKKRAGEVKRYLEEQGISQAQLDMIGFGETKPKIQTDNFVKARQNRRVEFKVIR